jgi:hypothetical protein
MRSAPAAMAARVLPASRGLIGRILVAMGIAMRKTVESGGACAYSDKTYTHAAFALAEKPWQFRGWLRLVLRP